ncbi:hypothetical protein TSOC_013625, partial [Tetrabaena socialis]
LFEEKQLKMTPARAPRGPSPAAAAAGLFQAAAAPGGSGTDPAGSDRAAAGGGSGGGGGSALPAERLAALLESFSGLGRELQAASADWQQRWADALAAAASLRTPSSAPFATASASVTSGAGSASASASLRAALQPAGQALREALRERCAPPLFVPSTDVPATVRGPGVSYTLTTGGCRLGRVATPVRRDLLLTCTQPGAAVARTVPQYTSAYGSGVAFKAAECRTDYEYGAEASISVDLWQPGTQPQDVLEAWQQRLARWKQRASEAAERPASDASGGRRAGGAGSADADGGRDGLAQLRELHAVVAAALREALT